MYRITQQPVVGENCNLAISPGDGGSSSDVTGGELHDTSPWMKNETSSPLAGASHDEFLMIWCLCLFYDEKFLSSPGTRTKISDFRLTRYRSTKRSENCVRNHRIYLVTIFLYCHCKRGQPRTEQSLIIWLLILLYCHLWSNVYLHHTVLFGRVGAKANWD